MNETLWAWAIEDSSRWLVASPAQAKSIFLFEIVIVCSPSPQRKPLRAALAFPPEAESASGADHHRLLN